MIKIAAVCSVAALGLAGCGGDKAESGDKAASSDGPVEISYVHRLADKTAVDKLVEQWNKENPDIQVSAEQFAGQAQDFMPQLKQNVADGKAACLAQVGYAELPGAFTDKLVQDVTDYVTDDVKSTYEGTIDLMSVGGKYYGIPQDNGPLVYFYNAKAFEDLGIEVPTTADEFVAAAKKAAEAGKYIATYQTDEIGNMFAGLAVAAGGAPYEVSGDGYKVNWDSDKNIKKAADFVQKLVDDKSALSVIRWDTTSFDAKVADGTIIGSIGAAWEYGGYQTAAGDAQKGQWKVAQLPALGDKAATGPDGGSGVAVTATCEYPEQAMKFNAWFNDQVDSLAASQAIVPASTTPAATPDEAKEFFSGQDIFAEFAKANKAMGKAEFVPVWNDALKATVETGANVPGGSATMDDVLKATQKKAADLLEQAGYQVK